MASASSPSQAASSSSSSNAASSEAPMQIRVRGLDGKPVQATVQPQFTLHDVKELLCHGCCQHPMGSVSKALGIPPPHVKLMLGCKEFDESRSLEDCDIRSGMTLDLFPFFLSACQVYIKRDWDRIGRENEPRYIQKPWACQNGRTAEDLKRWVAEECKLAAGASVRLEYSDGCELLDESFEDWATEGLVLTAVRYEDAVEPDSTYEGTGSTQSETQTLCARIAELEAVATSMIKDMEDAAGNLLLHDVDAASRLHDKIKSFMALAKAGHAKNDQIMNVKCGGA